MSSGQILGKISDIFRVFKYFQFFFVFLDFSRLDPNRTRTENF